MTDGKNFYHEPINNLIKQYGDVRKISAGHAYDYATECLLDYARHISKTTTD